MWEWLRRLRGKKEDKPDTLVDQVRKAVAEHCITKPEDVQPVIRSIGYSNPEALYEDTKNWENWKHNNTDSLAGSYKIWYMACEGLYGIRAAVPVGRFQTSFQPDQITIEKTIDDSTT